MPRSTSAKTGLAMLGITDQNKLRALGPQVSGAAVGAVARFFYRLHDKRQRGGADLFGQSASARLTVAVETPASSATCGDTDG